MIELTQVLSDEHQNILKVIGALKKECQAIENGRPVDQEFFATAIDFIRNYADKFHHAKEEDILFKAMCQDDVAMHCNPVDQMLHEHDLGRNYVKNLEEGLNQNNINDILMNARGYAYLLEDHISKEDNILYPMADQVLSLEKQQAIKRDFETAESVKFGPEVKEKYLSLVKIFEERI
ncbi:MAG: hemerythrin domain-containing protein [Candidatus Buchananbacteria bacterium]|nr:hemerythrin domain-containing protein [Candidatus Buchananbacteria bacterium]